MLFVAITALLAGFAPALDTDHAKTCPGFAANPSAELRLSWSLDAVVREASALHGDQLRLFLWLEDEGGERVGQSPCGFMADLLEVDGVRMVGMESPAAPVSQSPALFPTEGMPSQMALEWDQCASSQNLPYLSYVDLEILPEAEPGLRVLGLSPNFLGGTISTSTLCHCDDPEIFGPRCSWQVHHPPLANIWVEVNVTGVSTDAVSFGVVKSRF